MTINTGRMARFDAEKMRQYCEALFQNIRQGKIDDNSIYILHSSYLENFKNASQVPVVCAKIDGFDTCVTKPSSVKWRDLIN